MNTQNLKLGSADKLNFFSNLSTMVNAGLTTAESVNSLLEDSTGPMKILLTGISADLNQGKPLHTSLDKYPKIFDKVSVAIIKAAEESGTIDVVLKDIKDSVKKDIEFTDKVKSALTYPMIIMVVFTGVLILLLTFVIPKISSVFSKLRVTLPLPTKILIFLSDLVLHYTIPTFAVICVVTALLIFLYNKQRRLFVNTFLNLPYVSTMARMIDLTRLCRSLYLLLNSAIPLYMALEFTESVAIKADVQKAIARARSFVGSGKRLADGLRGQKAIPSLMVKIIEVGERSGTLDKSMADLTDYFDYQVTTTLQYMVTLLEPLILVVVGVIVGSMMMAIIAPIYSLIGQVGNVH